MVQERLIRVATLYTDMAHEKQTIERLEELRDQFDPKSDKYADVSQTIHYLKEAEARNDG